MDEYVKVNVKDYVNAGISNGTMVPREAYKFTRIIARPGVPNETIISWSVKQERNEIQEKINTVSVDPKTNIPGWVVTKLDDNGEIMVDNNGHINEWIIDDATFKKKYEMDEQVPGVFKPKGQNQVFVQIPDNITLEQWGSEMNIAAGGFINITDSNDMYGISKRDFEDTYKFVDEQNIGFAKK